MNAELMEQIRTMSKEKLLSFAPRIVELSQADKSIAKNLLTARAIELKCKGKLQRIINEADQKRIETIPDLPPYLVCKNGNYQVHAQLLADFIADTENYYIVQARDGDSHRLFWYEHGVYARLSETATKAKIKDIIAKYKRDLITTKILSDTYNLLLLADSRHYLPSDELLDADENIINFQNGILRLDTLKLDAHSPQVLSTIQVPCNWNLKEYKFPNFDSFLDHLGRGETEAKMTLLEVIGFCISNVHIDRFKKSLFLIGKGNCGKTQFIKLCERLIGSENFSAMPFQNLEKRFQLAKLYRKRLAADDDCRYASHSEINVFKSLTGGGLLDGEEKNKPPFTFTYRGMFLIAANDLPLFTGDRGSHVYERIIPVQCGDSIKEDKQDKELLEKLFSEREGIVVAAVLALKNAIQRNYHFTIGDNSKNLLKRYKIENDITLKFIEECCVDVSNNIKPLSTAQMWEAFCSWCRNNNEYIPRRKTFTQSIAERYNIPVYAVIKKSGNNRYYPFTLSSEYKEECHIFDSI